MQIISIESLKQIQKTDKTATLTTTKGGAFEINPEQADKILGVITKMRQGGNKPLVDMMGENRNAAAMIIKEALEPKAEEAKANKPKIEINKPKPE
ncbi:hypothetical protein [Vibrio phage vB_VhaS-a]|nr:hypothetical protein [Vibrio phage vB_VhaS-a]